jgi:hypothetical protein
LQSSAERRVCCAMLHWDKLLRHKPQSIQTFALPDPYEPMIRFFLRGGCFTREHRIFIEVNRTMTLNFYASLREASSATVTLDDQLLDRLDAKSE